MRRPNVLERLPEIWDQHDSLEAMGRELGCSREHIRKMSAKLRRQGVHLERKRLGGKPGVYKTSSGGEQVTAFPALGTNSAGGRVTYYAVCREDAEREAALDGLRLEQMERGR